ncbi:hypothetical protein FSP39_009780 [Pinctada imbricata]|uniref:B box-type domain-containing protein n=1 Tax=Pinctada imbricata TaxID=66713 RepID=A0AA89BVN4_PINIB|nr:hypothetical protein FSP39_009780 [Pinctada imbricata]
MALSKSVNLAHAQRAVPCNVCEDEEAGEYYCVECKQTLCSQCEKNHRRVAATRNHNIILRTQVADIDTKALACADHGEQASFHCEKCNVPVCTKCVTGQHKVHALSDIDDIIEKENKLLQDDIKALQRALPILKTQRGEVHTKRESYNKKIDKILKDIEDENQAAIEEINKKYNERVTNVRSIQNSHLAIFDGFDEEMKLKIVSYEKRISEYEDTVAKNKFPALRNVFKGKSSLPETDNSPKLPEPPTFVSGDLQSMVGNIGKLHISHSSLMPKLRTPTIILQFKCPVQGYPRICITKEGDVWLGGSESRELVMVDIKGQVLKRREIHNTPAALAVMDCGDVIISPRGSNSKSVSRLLKDGREQHLYDTSPSCSYGVSVTANQTILICTLDGGVVRINGDGTNVKQVNKGSGEWSAIHAVEAADGNIYITDRSNHAVVIVSKDGQVLSTIKHTTEGQKLQGPIGLVMDKIGNILCADWDNYAVYIIDQNQQMRELVGPSRGILYPQWLALDNDNNLWITQTNGTVHVIKYLSP